jgi:deazaflavin-dependent oxidoreductase (nitroreductase family)
MKRILVGAGALAAAATGGVAWWRRHPRVGARAVNRLINPWLVRQGIADVTNGEIALLEHVGRISGTVRATPVHPVDTDGGVRIIVPLGTASHWARNVVTAGHCRLQRGDVVLELDTPRLVQPTQLDVIPRLPARLMTWLGFRYLLLRRFAEHPGTLETVMTEATEGSASTEAAPEATPVA